MLTAVLQVNDQEHPDLFWALRGGGGSFGICTSFRFRTQEIKTVGFVEVSWRHQDLKRYTGMAKVYSTYF